MSLCIHRRTTLCAGTSRRDDPTLMARVGVLLLLARMSCLLWDSTLESAALSWLMAALAGMTLLDMLANDLPATRFRMPRLRRMRFLIYMAAAAGTSVVAFSAASAFPDSSTFVASVCLAALWMMLIAVRDLVYQINKDLL